MRLKYIFLIAAIFFTIFIWCNSLESGVISSNNSNSVTNIVINVIENINNHKPNSENLNFVLRKLAHFIEFAFCGLLYAKFFISINLKHVSFISLALMLLIAIADELLQLNQINRNASFLDSLLDLSGAACGIFLLISINKIKRED